ncbi:HypC/HybG/HupF family hydrogenase formation chaperone [Pseudonocardia benzenivorans]|uniref:HypC/HybG/HupF family hydrogenase formation chaperone n=1 Tax=Pseudonocardia benzenivorans TaxID=228005 RepID=A0ABW3VT22_9PSEU|nr:hydrogenase assembly protein HupF [Pseudonocardia sp. D17]
MCLGIPGRIVEVVDAAEHLAKVEIDGVRRMISVRLLQKDPPGEGDWVLVHVGFAMARIDEEEARLTLQAIERLGETYRDELAAYDSTSIV